MRKLSVPIYLVLFSAALGSGTTAFARDILPRPIVSEVQQNKQVKGTVSDDMGPIAGAAVMVKGTTNGVSTDLDGNFVLSDVKTGTSFQSLSWVT